MSICDQLWSSLETQPWSRSLDLAESLIWLLYARWLDTHARVLPPELSWRHWSQLPPRRSFRLLGQQVFPELQQQGPMTGHLLGLMLPTLSFEIPGVAALQQLLGLIETYADEALLDGLLPLLNIDEPERAVYDEAVKLLAPAAEDVIWDPACRSGRWLASCARYLQQRHWRRYFAHPQRLRQFRRQLFGRVSTRSEAMLSALNLLLADQPAPGLDGFSLPWPAPSLMLAQLSAIPADWGELLAPEGRLAIWHPASARRERTALQAGSLEIRRRPRPRQLQEVPPAYAC